MMTTQTETDTSLPPHAPQPVRQVFRLDDATLAEIVRIVQLGFLTGTNVVDYFRQIRLEAKAHEPASLVPTPEYLAWQEKNIKTLEDAAKVAMETAETPADGVELN